MCVWGLESGCLSVFRCVFGCVCVECVIYVIFQVSVTIVDFLFFRPKFLRVNLVECAFAILFGKFLS